MYVCYVSLLREVILISLRSIIFVYVLVMVVVVSREDFLFVNYRRLCLLVASVAIYMLLALRLLVTNTSCNSRYAGVFFSRYAGVFCSSRYAGVLCD